MMRRIIIIGGPRVGKTTLSQKLKDEFQIHSHHTSAELESLFPAERPESWSKQSEHAAKWFDSSGDWICEGVQMARALRKWLRAHPGEPLDADILTLKKPFEKRLQGQESMAKGVDTVFREIEKDLVSRGARIHRLNDPNEAIHVLQSGWAGQQQRSPMLIEYTPEQYNALPPAQQKLCTEKDGKYTFEFETPTDVAGLRKNKTELLTELKKAQDALKNYDGIDPTKYAELVKAQEEAERATLEGKGQYETLVTQLKDQHANQLKQTGEKHAEEKKAWEGEKHSLTAALEEKLIDAEAISALSKHTKAVNLLMPHVKAQIKVFNEDGKYVARVIQPDGKPRIGDAQGTPMTIEQLVEEMKASDDYLRAFDANPNGGGGAATGGVGTALGADLSKYSPVEKLKIANKQANAA